LIALPTSTQVHDVDWNFGIVAGSQLLPDHVLDIGIGRIVRNRRWRHRLLADCVGIAAGDAKQVALYVNGKAATERLGDETARSLPQGQGFAGRDDNCRYIPGQRERFVGVSEHGFLTRLKQAVGLAGVPISLHARQGSRI
jgi:hypothetical protein